MLRVQALGFCKSGPPALQGRRTAKTLSPKPKTPSSEGGAAEAETREP